MQTFNTTFNADLDETFVTKADDSLLTTSELEWLTTVLSNAGLLVTGGHEYSVGVAGDQSDMFLG